jgi:cell division protein FtsB
MVKMLINTKYLVITIISVFVALGLGILIGFQLDSQDIVLQQQESLIQALEEKFEQMSETNLALENEIKDLRSFQIKIQQYLENTFQHQIKGDLEGLSVALIETSSDYRYPETADFLNKAGVNVDISLFITDEITNISQEKQNRLDLELGSTEHKDLESLIVEEIVDFLAGGPAGGIDCLQDLGLIEVNGTFDTPSDFVILAGGSKDKNEKVFKIDLPLVKELKEKSIPLIGVESGGVEYSYVEYYRKQGISTVDNVDTIPGQISLALIMTGQEGNYGIKGGASALMPLLSKEKLDEDIRIDSGL